jgi:hypothetical protein
MSETMSQSNILFTDQDQQDLQKTQDVRRKIVDQMFVNNRVPNDAEDRDLLMKALESMDKQVLSRAKIKSDDQANKDQKNVANVIAGLLLKTKVVASTQESTTNTQLPASVTLENDVPGLKELGSIPVDIKDIVG